jgi:hypothetical protein
VCAPCNEQLGEYCDKAIWWDSSRVWKIGDKDQIGTTVAQILTCYPTSASASPCPSVSGLPYENGIVWRYSTTFGTTEKTTTEIKVKCTSFTNGK